MKHSRLNIVLLVLLVLILLPALFYTGYEFSRLSEAEENLSMVYEQQLDAVLFSVNQYAWDVTGTWFAEIQGILRQTDSDRKRHEALARFVQDRSAIRTISLHDSTGRIRESSESAGQDFLLRLSDSLAARRDLLTRLLRYRTELYLKIEPLLIPLDTARPRLSLIAVVADGSDQGLFGAVSLESREFVTSVIEAKLSDVAGNDLLLVCRDRRSGEVLFSTGPMEKDRALTQTRRLWLFPEYEVGIRLKGRTVEEIARERFTRNGILFVIVDILLIVGVILVYRTFRREIELAALKSDFVSNVSHELKTPLALIRMFAETLEMGRVRDEKQRQEYYSIIVQETERLTRLINNILTFSRIEAGRKKYHFRPTDLNRIVEDVMAMYSFHLEHKGFTARTEYAPALPPVMADEEAVAEALINLIDNAMKYSEEEKRVIVRTVMIGNTICIEVEDAGIGIAIDQQNRIFEKFYRISDGLVHTAKGSGLGLSLVRHIMDAHGGTVDVHSESGSGSLFRLAFPAEQSVQQQ